MGKSKLLCLSWILAFLAVIQTSMNGKEETASFQGIAENREVMINSKHPVRVQEILAVPGQTIQKGQLLAVLERPELTLKINEISHQLEEIRTRHTLGREDIRAQIRRLEAQKAAETAEIGHRIQQIRSRMEFNKSLTAELSSIPKQRQSGKKKTACPLNTQIENLKKERRLTAQRFQTEINALNQKLAASESPETIRAEQLKKELVLLEDEKASLRILSPMDGLVGSIHCKAGEKVSPFEAVLTLHTRAPSSVRGYIHENVHNRASEGDTVFITALTGDDKAVAGKIVGVGSRIVEYPLRLKKRPEMQLWGREVEIRLPEDNPFLLGEKVMIRTSGGRKTDYLAKLMDGLNLTTFAAESQTGRPKEEPLREITSFKFSEKSPQIEASGLIYLHDLDKYLVISDETEDRKPVLFLMDDQARITNALRMEGMDIMDDMEAICRDASGRIYLSCSQARKKNGTLPDERKIFVGIRREGTRLTAENHVLLYDLLKSAASGAPEASWAQFVGGEDTDIEIEGMFVHQDALYLGFKKPLKEKRAVILCISDFRKMLKDNHLDAGQVRIWRELELSDRFGENFAGISDLCLHRDQLMVLSCTRQKNRPDSPKKTGSLRIFDFRSGGRLNIRCFDNLNAEGVAFDSRRNCPVLTFDGGSKSPSKFQRLRKM